MRPARGIGRQTTTLALLVLVVCVTVGLAGLAAADPVRTDIDDDTELTESASVSEYQSTGSTTAEMDGVDATITVTDSLDDLEDEAFYGDVPETSFMHEWSHRYIVLDTREGLDRQYRIHIPEDYIPAATDKTPTVLGDATVDDADLEPIEDRSATSVEVTVTEPGVVAIPVSRLNTGVGGYFDGHRERLENVTGYRPSVPGMSGDDAEWQHVSGSQLDAETAVELNATGADGESVDLRVQYRDGSDENASWLPAPTGETLTDPVYTVERDGTVVVVTTASAGETPDIRYRESSAGGGVTGGLRDARRGLGDLLDRLPFTTISSTVTTTTTATPVTTTIIHS